MPGTTPPRPATPGLSDLLSLFGSNNPFAALSRSAEQFRAAVTGFVEVVQTFRQTMDNLNAVAQRMNRMLDDLEEPIHTVMPQITKSAETASRMLATMREPVERVAPALTQLADTLNNPIVTDLPRRMTETMDVLSSIPHALGPLGQVADLAGGFFGGRGLGAFGAPSRPATSSSRIQRPVVVEAVVVEEVTAPRRPRRTTTHTAPSAQDTFRRSAAKHPGAKEPAPAKRTTAKAAKQRTPGKKAATKKAPAKRTSAKQAAAKKEPAKRTSAKKAAPRASRSTTRR